MLIRYPGSKDRTAKIILEQLGDLNGKRRICEPFAGTAAITYQAIKRGLVDEVWINDADPYIADLHSTVKDNPEDLSRLIDSYTPQTADFYEWRLAAPSDSLTNAFRLIVLHQISFSGLGRKAGSPIGGVEQQARYKVDCRWNAKILKSKITTMHNMLTSVNATITCGDWSHCPDWSWYIDPPYYQQGESLYAVGALDHARLSAHLMEKREPWVLSYDDAPEVRSLYSQWAHIEHGLIETYLNHGKRPQAQRKQELLIWPKSRKRTASVDQLDMEWQ